MSNVRETCTRLTETQCYNAKEQGSWKVQQHFYNFSICFGFYIIFVL
jgi:hypothetical protein